jgi:DNA polymerase elongation subunit (family B)
MFLDVHLLKRCLFIDIETVSEVPHYDELSEEKQKLWSLKALQLHRTLGLDADDIDVATLYEQKAGIFSEFAKVVCISMGFLSFEDETPTKIRIKSLAGDDEKRILEDFSLILINHYNDPENSKICGHNIREFDLPFLCRRMVIHQVKFPSLLDMSGKKPWQTAHIMDTLEMWRFGDYKNYTSLQLLCHVLNIPSPKDNLDGSMVSDAYWHKEDLDSIVVYCQKDVVTVIQIMMKFAGLPIFSQDKIEYINQRQE